MDASTVSAAIAALSAAIAAFSAWNSRRSALASESALREASQQRRIDNSRQMLNALGGVYDDAMAMVESLVRDLGRDPVKVTRCRDALRRSEAGAWRQCEDPGRRRGARHLHAGRRGFDLRRSLPGRAAIGVQARRRDRRLVGNWCPFHAVRRRFARLAALHLVEFRLLVERTHRTGQTRMEDRPLRYRSWR